MSDTPRSRWPTLLTLGFMLLLAGGSFWMLRKFQQTDGGGTAQALAGEPDYTMDDFRYTSVAQDGKVSYLVEGERLSHYPDSDDSVVRQPRLTSYYPERPPMTLRAETARINSDHSQVHLHDKVLLRRPQANGAGELTVNSDYMLVLTQKDIVKSDRPVRGQQGTSTLNGTGMVADNAQRTLTLNNQVIATFDPPPKAKP